MTRGISKERLQGLWHGYDTPQECNLLLKLIGECIELNPWKPIESAPKDREVLGWILSGYRSIIHWSEISKHWVNDNGDYVTPTNWCELPDDPK